MALEIKQEAVTTGTDLAGTKHQRHYMTLGELETFVGSLRKYEAPDDAKVLFSRREGSAGFKLACMFSPEES